MARKGTHLDSDPLIPYEAFGSAKYIIQIINIIASTLIGFYAATFMKTKVMFVLAAIAVLCTLVETTTFMFDVLGREENRKNHAKRTIHKDFDLQFKNYVQSQKTDTKNEKIDIGEYFKGRFRVSKRRHPSFIIGVIILNIVLFASMLWMAETKLLSNTLFFEKSSWFVHKLHFFGVTVSIAAVFAGLYAITQFFSRLQNAIRSRSTMVQLCELLTLKNHPFLSDDKKLPKSTKRSSSSSPTAKGSDQPLSSGQPDEDERSTECSDMVDIFDQMVHGLVYKKGVDIVKREYKNVDQHLLDFCFMLLMTLKAEDAINGSKHLGDKDWIIYSESHHLLREAATKILHTFEQGGRYPQIRFTQDIEYGYNPEYLPWLKLGFSVQNASRDDNVFMVQELIKDENNPWSCKFDKKSKNYRLSLRTDQSGTSSSWQIDPKFQVELEAWHGKLAFKSESKKGTKASNKKKAWIQALSVVAILGLALGIMLNPDVGLFNIESPYMYMLLAIVFALTLSVSIGMYFFNTQQPKLDESEELAESSDTDSDSGAASPSNNKPQDTTTMMKRQHRLLARHYQSSQEYSLLAGLLLIAVLAGITGMITHLVSPTMVLHTQTWVAAIMAIVALAVVGAFFIATRCQAKALEKSITSNEKYQQSSFLSQQRLLVSDFYSDNSRESVKFKHLPLHQRAPLRRGLSIVSSFTACPL